MGSELFQKPEVVVEEEADVVDAVFEHGDALRFPALRFAAADPQFQGGTAPAFKRLSG
jgi:hypothetical protein